MNLRQLEYLVAIADEGSFTRAAELLLVAQPSLSHQIRVLEREVGGPLLERLPRGVRLTPAGESFVTEARAALNYADRARHGARCALGLQRGRLEVGMLTSLAVGLIPPVLSAWRAQHPGVELSLREFTSRRDLETAVRGGECDLAVGGEPHRWTGRTQALGWEQFVVLLPEDDPALDNQSVELSTLGDRRWVHFQQGHGLGEILDAQAASAGFTVEVAIRTTQVATAPALAGAGLGPTLVPDNVVPTHLAHLVRPLQPALAREIVAFGRTDWSATVEAFAAVLRQHPWSARPRGAEVVHSP